MIRARIRVDGTVCRRFWGRRTVAVVSVDGGLRHGERRSRTGMARGGSVGCGSWRQAHVRPEMASQSELGFPGPALWKMQSEAARRVGEPSDKLSAHPGAARSSGPGYAPAPAPPARRLAAKRLVQPHAVLQVSDGVLISAWRRRPPVPGSPPPGGDEAVIAVAGKEGQLGTGRGFHPPDDEPQRRAHSGRGCTWSPPRRRRRPASRVSAPGSFGRMRLRRSTLA